MFFRITPPKNSDSASFPASIYLKLEEIVRVEEVRARVGTDSELQLRIFTSDGKRQDVNEENTSKTTMLAILGHIEETCVNPKKKDPKWVETEGKVADALSKQTKATKPEPAMAG